MFVEYDWDEELSQEELLDQLALEMNCSRESISAASERFNAAMELHIYLVRGGLLH